MTAASYSYVRAESVEHVCRLLSEYGTRARILSGGQSLMPALGRQIECPELLIDINRIEALSGALYDGKRIRIGANTRQADVMLSHAVAKYVPLLAQAMPYVAPVAVRNRGTFGGSIALSNPGAELPACLVALEARVVVESVRGRREVKAADFFVGSGKTALVADELLIEALIDPQPKGERTAFVEGAGPEGYATAGVALRTGVADGKLSGVRIVLFGAGMKPALARGVMAAIEDRPRKEISGAAVEQALARDLGAAGATASIALKEFSALLLRAVDQNST